VEINPEAHEEVVS